ncbi:chemotaxis protein CheW [Desulfoluna sp.]|uniref:chemotaxis protein CheW n=1 Tax=Desulfoluna sp. TaxID=2045199 RepID=UPI0026175840|nr:chemotaxis protein CheW [Desulfoluna sp.]
MNEQIKRNGASSMLELATFFVGQAQCGIDILKIQEINKQIDVTGVPQSPDYVVGVLNLRGRIVTVIDLGLKTGLSPITRDKDNRNIIVDSMGEHIGLLVDRISDVMSADPRHVEPPPANLGGIEGSYFEGVVKTDAGLIGVLDIERVLAES